MGRDWRRPVADPAMTGQVRMIVSVATPGEVMLD